MPTYEVTCAFGGPVSPTPGNAIDRVLNTTSAMREEGIEIFHRNTTIDSNGDESNQMMISRFTAPTEGIVGWHVFRAQIPVCGIIRVGNTEGTGETTSDTEQDSGSN